MKTGPLLPLALGLIGQYFTIAILVSTYPEQLYFPGVRIAALVLFLLLDVSAYVLWRSLIRPQFSVLRDLPQPPTRGGILTGHVGAVFSSPLGRQVAEWVNDIPNQGLLWFRGMLGAEYLIVNSAESLRDVLFVRPYDFEKTSAFRRYTRRFMAAGLVTQEGEAHKATRKAISPVFQPRAVDALKPMLTDKSERLIQALLKRCSQAGWIDSPKHHHGTAVIDICDWATRFALDVACLVGFGEDFGLAETPEVLPILQAYTTIFTGSKDKMNQYAWHNTAPQFLVKALPHKLDAEMDAAHSMIRQLGMQAVNGRIELIQRGEKPPQDFLTECIQSNKFSPQACCDELLILLAAAHESTAALIAMTIYQLTQQPELQNQLRQEFAQFDLVAGGQATVPETSYEQMTLLNATLNEMMRLEPPLPITLRKTVRNTSIANHVVKAGTYVIISPYAMGRSVDIWGPTVQEFNPFRWIERSEKPGVAASAASPFGTLNEHGGASNHYGMLTFLKGPKGCTGERFAKAELRRVIAALVAGFEWTCEQEHVPEQVGIVVVKPEGGIKVRCRPLGDVEKVEEGEEQVSEKEPAQEVVDEKKDLLE